MSTFGKILVFVNLVFSLVVCALIIMVYVARTNWKDAYDKQEQQAKAASAGAGASAEQLRATVDETRGTLAANAAELDRMKKDLDTAKTDLAAAKARDKDLTAKAALAEATVKRLQTEVAKRSDEVKKQEQFLAETTDRLTNVVKEMNAQREQRVAAQIENNRLRVHNQQMVAKLEDLQKDNIRLKQGGTAVASGKRVNPPPEDVEGVIKTADSGGLVVLSVGSDSGLQIGHTVEAYRLEPTPMYLGTIQITNVRPGEAVGRPLARPGMPRLQPGDRVAGKITPGA